MHPLFEPNQTIHFVGIGGTGISAIARIFLQRGYTVTGSDQNKSNYTTVLEQDGARVYEGHAAENIKGADALIISSAIPEANVEVQAARQAGIPIYKRSEILGEVMDGHFNICVAGTHGKTTTTSMITHILVNANRDPNYIIGSRLSTTGQNADVGSGEDFVIEADEYDNMFHGLHPNIAVITNLEYDHPDFFDSPDTMIASFRAFADRLAHDGLLIACGDDENVRDLVHEQCQRGLHTITYGLNYSDADWQADQIQDRGGMTKFTVIKKGHILGELSLQVPGRHNVQNALAATIVALERGIAFSDIVEALATFQNSARRFDIREEVDGVIVVDDYAHHPTEIRVTLQAARERYPDHEIWAVWQPHTYSRTKQFWDDYAIAFESAHHVLVTDIFAAREQPVEGVSSQLIVGAIQHPDVRYTPTFSDVVNVLFGDIKPPAVVIIMSAGDAPQIGIDFLQQRKEQIQ